MVTIIYTTIVFCSFMDRWLQHFLYWWSYFDTWRIPFIPIISMYLRYVFMYLCCKQNVGSLFLCKGAFSCKFLFRWICNWGFIKFSLLCNFSFYTFADVVAASCFYCKFWVSCCSRLHFSLDLWLVKILVHVLKLSCHFGDCSLIFLFMVEFDCQFLDKVVIALQ